MRRSSMYLCALALAAALAGCGANTPVAKVGDSLITESEFEKWLLATAAVQAHGEHSHGGLAPPTHVHAPDPPNFQGCVAAKRKQPLLEGREQESEAQLRGRCKTEYETLKRDVMGFLIQAEWVQQEAEKRGIEVSDAEVQRSLDAERKASFPNAKAYRQFLDGSGISEEDIRFRFKLDLLREELEGAATTGVARISDRAIRAYYEENRKRFAAPELRHLRVVVTTNKDTADEARRALESGRSFRDVSRRFSIDETSKGRGGELPAVAEGQQEQPLDKAVFAADVNELVGPVRTQFGWYVFEVAAIVPALQQSLEQSRPTIRNLLRSRRREKALERFWEGFRRRYRAATDCASGYRVADCRNAA